MASLNQDLLAAGLALHMQPARELTKSERLRKLASVQRREGMAGIRRLRHERRWTALAEEANPGVSKFYGVPHTAEARADVATWAFKCRDRANAAAAEARSLEAAEAPALLIAAEAA